MVYMRINIANIGKLSIAITHTFDSACLKPWSCGWLCFARWMVDKMFITLYHWGKRTLFFAKFVLILYKVQFKSQ